MSSRLLAVAFDAVDPAASGRLWAGVLGREVVPETDGVLVPGDDRQVGLRFVASTAGKRRWNRLHLHVTSDDVEAQRRTVEAVIALGGRRRGDGALPYGRDLYLADAGGEEFCVIEPANGFLAGCGPLGEVTCEGTPAAGRFWAAALGWAVVWDQDGQVAIQAPAGGTKISWDGQADPGSPGWNRQRFALAAADPDAEAERLVGLGATRVGERTGALVLADPDGTELTLERE